MTTSVIRYTTKPDRADENAQLIRAVFAELADRQPDGVRYTALRIDGTDSFVHLVMVEGDHNPLVELPAFQRFQAEIGDRILEGPIATAATAVGAYRLP